jgi:hypothetical protein
MSNIGECSISELLSQITDSIQSRYERTCPVISDRRFFKMGLSRVLSNVKSGREFLQEQMEVAGEKTARQPFVPFRKRDLYSCRIRCTGSRPSTARGSGL